MPLRIKNIFTIFLFVFFVSVLAAKSTGNSKKKKPNVKLSDNISKNPFLQNTQLNKSSEGNIFLQDRDTAINWNNIFVQPANNGTGQEQGLSVNNIAGPAGATDSVHVPTYNTNPFLQSLNNKVHSTATPSTVNPGGNERPSSDHISDRIYENSNNYGNSRRKSEIMCQEYGRQISSTASVLHLVSTPVVVSVSTETCSDSSQLVIGGVTATPGEFPHQVSLGKFVDGGYKSLCGGSLIAPEWVLTAAHCTYDPSPTDVRIGVHDLRDTQRGISTTVNKMVRHPNFKPPTMYNDIALVKLNKVIEFDKTIRPACLYQRYDSVPFQAWVSGWGVTEFDNEEGSDTLQKAELMILDNIRCSINHKLSIQIPYGITQSMICAGDPAGGWTKDTCVGDSGGPLQIIHPDNKCLFQVFGITSFGQGCAFANKPGVYTKVSHYLNWIEDIVWP